MCKDASHLLDLLHACSCAQEKAVRDWHVSQPADERAALSGHDPESLTGLVLAQNFTNCALWHIEDTVRRTDVDDAVIADCKRRIDGFNQRRNDLIEEVDETLARILRPLLPAASGTKRLRHNTETLGMVIDRLSILALKIYHMNEQIGRCDVDEPHRETSRKKLAVLREQRADLFQALLDLVEDFLGGAKEPKVYYQFKMYNDPALNPELYEHG
ncbi:MAG: DUF4254 domain-containing protein [Candidatus Accumulibacter sp.]|nr:DUF4254 domain-containing protein [Accumulibacter sp.]